ncbi:MAG: HIT domain-containing protein [Alphaproteobacteria bacterium]|jgi:histidine triad (HIT) family protein|nr:HIT domain-containing protein [Alphaproteobacteria bacterium]
MTYDSDNIFAKILRGEIPSKTIFENEVALAFHDINPMAPVHVLVIPKGAYVSHDDFSANASQNEKSGFTEAVGEVAKITGLAQSAGGQGYRLITNSGPEANQEVPHYHVHVIGGRNLGVMVGKI